MSQYEDYPKVREHADHSNDELVCFFCKNLVSDIQGILENHKPDCKYRLKKEAEQQ